ncbi:hypothetical protein C4J83_4097 [Pseudomonas sp. LBUM920]|nr:hypothetical protein C4J83_4097 [Pseudomonas sp. LBUM920]
MTALGHARKWGKSTQCAEWNGNPAFQGGWLALEALGTDLPDLARKGI